MTQQFVLKEFREQLNLSQIEMARFLRTSRSQVAMVERGERILAPDPGNGDRRLCDRPRVAGHADRAQ